MTLWRWRRQPEFSSRLESVASSGLEELARKLNALSLTSVETLQEVLCQMTLPASTRMKAALGVLGVVASVNAALERGLQHRVGDFDLEKRWDGPTFTYNADGRRIEHGRSA
jgi:hypothetical protein